jgi:hypothetical protein
MNGYNGQKCYFINNTVFLYLCGTSIKAFNIETNQTETFMPEYLKNQNKDENEDSANGICLLTANTAINKFAFSDTRLSPKVYIHEYKGFNKISQLENGAEIEYTKIEFSNGEAIYTLSSIPDMEIVIW